MSPDAGPSAPARVSWILLTMGDRPAELEQAVASVLDHGDPFEVLIVINGPGEVAHSLTERRDPRLKVIRSERNVGIPGGRNLGAGLARGEVVAFLDDDARLITPGVGRRLGGLFGADPALGVVGFRIVEPYSGRTARRHVPRLGRRGEERSGSVTAFLGGACAVRSDLWRDLGGQAAEFFYSHEETDFAWRAIDRGCSVFYAADLCVEHPATSPGRHPDAHRRSMRNRVWMVRRNLPYPLAVIHLGIWLPATLLRSRDRAAWRSTLTGFAEGWRTPVSERRPMSWRTVWRLIRLGRPPII